MIKNPKVSVLMPIYRTKEEYLREAIESVLAQTFADFEFLILDDCPEDDREKIVKSYKDKRIKYFKNEQNLGIAKSRNKLIDMAKGEYLAVFDHDDISLPERLEKEVAYLDEHPDVGVVGSWREDFPGGEVYKFPEDDLEIRKLLTDICAITHSASMIRKSVLMDNNIRYEEEFSPSEDYALWIKLTEFTKFHNIQEVLFKYRIYNGNTSHNQISKMYKATKRLHLWIRNKYPFIYQDYINDRTKVFKLKLFQVIPLLKVKINHNKMTFYLFYIFPFMMLSRKVLPWPK